MKTNKIIILSILILLVVSLVYAVTSNVTTFTTGNTEENISWTEESNQTLYISIPIYSYVKNITFEIEGVLIE